MSEEINTRLLEEAAFMVDYFEGTPIARVLEQDLESNDLEALAVHMREARQVLHDLEYSPEQESTDIY